MVGLGHHHLHIQHQLEQMRFTDLCVLSPIKALRRVFFRCRCKMPILGRFHNQLIELNDKSAWERIVLIEHPCCFTHYPRPTGDHWNDRIEVSDFGAIFDAAFKV